MISGLIDENILFSQWKDTYRYYKYRYEYTRSEEESEKYGKMLEQMDNNYRFRFCEDEKSSVDNVVNEILDVISKIDDFKVKDVSYGGESDFEFNKIRHITKKTGRFSSKTCATIYTNSMFKTQRFVRINISNEFDTNIYALFKEGLSKDIDRLNKKRSEFENLHRYDYEHEERWLFPKRISMYEKRNEDDIIILVYLKEHIS